MKSLTYRLAVLVCVASFLGSMVPSTPVLARSSTSTTSPPVTLADLAWLAGNWIGEEGETTIQEHWSAAEGNSMMGMFRLVQGGQVVFYEFMSIEQEDAGPVLRIKHFDPGLVGWEEKADSVVFHLQQIEDRRAVFQTHVDGQPESLVFVREDDQLTLTLEKPAENQSTPFRFELAQP